MASFMKEFEHLKIQLEEVKRATNNFDKSKVIGTGGFGAVFRGEVSHSKGRSIVAFKRLDRRHGQGDPEFLKEIMMLSRYTHENLISLLGYCDERDEKILVYEYASNGSLDKRLGDPRLTWTQRLKICLGAAKGLTYLHDPNGTYQRVLHCDIKSANILLDEYLNAKVADFGLAKMGPANQQYSILVTNAIGTPGYCDPQYMATYTLAKESDVYSFGVVLFEVLCGKLCFQFRNGQLKVFVPMWKKCYTDKNLDKIIFKYLLMYEMDPTSLETFSNIAFQCLHEFREERPTMSVVVEKLELALKSQKLNDTKLEKIVQAAVDPLVYRSIQELKVLLSKGLFLNEGKMWFSLNDKGQHCLLISIDECIGSYNKEKEDYSSRYSHDYNSRFQVGSYYTRCRKFDARVSWSQFLTPGITYTMNLVFKCPELFKQKVPGKQEYIAIRYRRVKEKEKRISIVYVGDKREDEWLKAGLYQFTADNNQSDNNINFLYHKYFGCGLVIEGIEFQPLENVEFEDDDQVLIDEYRDILEATAYRPLFYRSVQELKLLLSRGILLNRGRTWFYLNDKGQHCEMISMKECLILDAEVSSAYASDYNSRFPEGALYKQSCKFRARVKAQFLTPYITYTVNLVFKFNEYYGKDRALKQRHIGLRYKLEGDTKTFISHLAHKREDNWWMVELCRFPSYGKTVDIQIIFQGIVNDKWIVEEGIEFRPLEKWFSLNDNGQHCLLISIDECIGSYNREKEDYSSRYSHDYNSRFQVGSYNTCCRKFDICVSWSQFLTPGITYTMNLVFKCPELFKQKEPGKQEFIAIRYRREKEKEKRISIVHVGDKRADEWLKAGLYQFTASNNQSNNTINFLYHKYFGYGLIIEGIEFQPLEKVDFGDDDQVLIDEYQEILEASAYPPLFYTSVQELKLLLSRGILLNGGRTWFYLNDKGQHCEMISMKECLILDAEEMYACASDYNSRFPEGALYKQSCKFRARVKAQFLTPYITYTVNLVFKFNEYYGKDRALKQRHIGLKYKLDGDTKTFISHLAYKREDNWWMVELCQFPSDGITVDIQIIFLGIDNDKWIVEEGIEFRPLEKAAERQALEDKIEKEADMQIISNSDDTMRTEVSYDYVEDMIKW